MISYAEALALINDVVKPMAAAHLPLRELIGAATSETVTSNMAVPGFANSAMDGFALRANDTVSAAADTPLTLNVAGIVAAGDPPPDAPPPGASIEIMTGAPMPAGCDAVVPIERVVTQGETNGVIASIRIETPATPGQNVRAAGEDFMAGQPVLGSGCLIEPHDVMALAATGIDAIRARASARIAIVTTGSELTASGTPEQDGMIRDSNGPYLEAFIAQTGAQLTARRNVPDAAPALDAALRELASTTDVILTTGGVSAGRYDLIPDAIKRSGGKVIFHKVAMRPGKPLLFAQLAGGTLMFGLPGNPMAVAAGLRFFVVPALRRLQGLAPEHYLTAICDAAIRKRADLRFFGKAFATIDSEGRLRARLLPGQESFKIQPLTAANCWAIVTEGREHVAEGELIQVAPLYPTRFLQPVPAPMG
ncbi:MAG: molybdopterin molybdotransferase MoeA [Gammaproteobacteria bacterium]|nr:MAG: molybdopterin molybdotransferase MoeA [Gammaproteobacteria bacterium]